MSLGRLSARPNDGAAAVVARVNELLAPFWLEFRPTGTHAQVREAVGDAVWELVKVPQPEPTPVDFPITDAALGALPTTTAVPWPVYRLSPQPDITALELARLQALAGFQLHQHPSAPPVPELLGDLMRHFVEG